MMEIQHDALDSVIISNGDVSSTHPPLPVMVYCTEASSIQTVTMNMFRANSRGLFYYVDDLQLEITSVGYRCTIKLEIEFSF